MVRYSFFSRFLCGFERKKHNTQHRPMKVGIHAISYYIPTQYLPIKSLANARDIEYAKLNKGLGLTSMSFPDIDEDAATMGAKNSTEIIPLTPR